MAEWRKAIPETRDRLQSRLLVLAVGGLLSLLTAFRLIALVVAILTPGLVAARRYHAYPHATWLLFAPWIVSLTFGLLVWAVRAATIGGILFGSMICLQICAGTMRGETWHSGLVPLITLFVLTFSATRAGRTRKAGLGVAESRRGRNAGQIIANLGMAGLAVWVGFFTRQSGTFDLNVLRFWEIVLPEVLLLAALCEATADTVSSEIGQAFGGTPFLLTTFRRVPPGTDGAISLLGTTSGILGAALVALAGMAAMHLTLSQAAIALLGGVAGLLFDSILGATVERKGWLGNDLVNFSSTAFAALVALSVLAL